MKSKPLFRWTVHSTTRIGYEILAKSVIETPENLGIDRFQWMICFNGNDNIAFSIIQDIAKISKAKIKVIKQKSEDCPIKINNLLGMWKICPPRLTNSHEIICDNDIIITKKFPKIDDFLNNNKTMILSDPIRYYGNLDYLHEQNEQWNSGFMGIPPGFDFKGEIIKAWEKCGSPKEIGYPEEQSLLMKVLRKDDSIIIERNEIVEVEGHTHYEMNGNEYGFHFVQSNRENHIFANHYIHKA